MSELKYDPRNYRIHNDKNKRVIRKSLEQCGAGRSVLVDNDNVLIAGNGVYEQALAMGLKVRFVESDGEELIVVKRTDISSDDEKRKILALADNYSSDTSIFDFDAVLEDFSSEDLDAWEFALSDVDLGMLDDLKQNNFISSVREDSETFDFTLTLPKYAKEQVEMYVKENTKLPLVELLLKTHHQCLNAEVK